MTDLKAKVRELEQLSDSEAKARELEIRKTLKTKATMESWILLSECQWRRGALREALTSAESAVSCDTESVMALTQVSRIARSLAAEAENQDAQHKLVAQSVERARTAISKSPTSGSCWLALGLALYFQAVAEGGLQQDIKKALAAVVQATKLDPNDGDALLNRGIIEHSQLMFADAALSFQRAASCDESLKQQTGVLAGRSVGMMRAFAQRNSLPPEELKKTVGSKVFGAAVARGQVQRPDKTILGKWSEIVALQQQQQQQQQEPSVVQPLLILVPLRLISGKSELPIFECVDVEGHVVALSIHSLYPDAIPVPQLDSKGRFDVNAPLTSLAVGVPPAELSVVPQKLVDGPGKADAQKHAAKAVSTVDAMTANFAPLHVVSVNAAQANSIFIDGKAPDSRFVTTHRVQTVSLAAADSAGAGSDVAKSS